MSLPVFDFSMTRLHPFKHITDPKSPFAAVDNRHEISSSWHRLCIVLKLEAESSAWALSDQKKRLRRAERHYTNMVKAENLLVEINKLLPDDTTLLELKCETSEQRRVKFIEAGDAYNAAEDHSRKMADLKQWAEAETEVCDAFYAFIKKCSDNRLPQQVYLDAVFDSEARSEYRADYWKSL
jgi:hypothetical protein